MVLYLFSVAKLLDKELLPQIECEKWKNGCACPYNCT